MERRHQCDVCCEKFEKRKDLRRHIRHRRKIFDCEHCDRKFCNINNLQKHLRSQIGSSRNIDVNSPITSRTGFENDIDFRNVYQEHISQICDKKSNYKFGIKPQLL